jgi:hypothetical protein
MPRLTILSLALLLAGCAAQLRPAPEASLVPGQPGAARATADGVTVTAQARAWRGRPPGLEMHVTPVLITIDNGSRVPVRVRYADFALVDAGGRRFAARGPFEVRGAVAEPLPLYAFPRGPFLVRDIAGRPVLVDPFWYDPFYLDFPRYRWVDLPTGDMVQLALPEKVVEPGARVSGFVYFEPLERAASPLTLTVRLVDDRRGEPFATAAIPFVLK